jgi:hypothetical protein
MTAKKDDTMDRIIAGRFPSRNEADAVAATMATIVEKEDICIIHNDAPGHRPAGIMLSVRIGSPKGERLVISTLRKGHAKDIEQAEGTWNGGDWTDFDPVSAPRLVKQ